MSPVTPGKVTGIGQDDGRGTRIGIHHRFRTADEYGECLGRPTTATLDLAAQMVDFRTQFRVVGDPPCLPGQRAGGIGLTGQPRRFGCREQPSRPVVVVSGQSRTSFVGCLRCRRPGPPSGAVTDSLELYGQVLVRPDRGRCQLPGASIRVFNSVERSGQRQVNRSSLAERGGLINPGPQYLVTKCQKTGVNMDQTARFGGVEP